ncbi:MAG: flagellar protein export ATPase FliI [Hyphomicrobiales bacterium]|nr:flagellar protein export ATPase FliI [Hyphomicrobiales bacterium]
MGALQRLSELNRPDSRPAKLIKFGGTVECVSPNLVTVAGISQRVSLGQVVRLGENALGEVVRVESGHTYICPFETDRSCNIGDLVFADEQLLPTPNQHWLGRVVNAMGQPIDGLPPLAASIAPDAGPSRSKHKNGIMQRARLNMPLKTGVKVIDIFTPLCRGQRLGIFAGSGVGKSTLLSMLAKSDAFDVVVVALVGERGREVREFLVDSIGEEGMQKTVAVVATSDESPMLRRRAPELALDVCETFAQQGNNVLLLLDSLTRYAHSLREISVANGEPPIARGYTSSVFTQLPKLLERAGAGVEGDGSITAISTVLVDGDDHNDPVADAVRGIIDGHLVLDRAIAEEGRYPPVSPLASISRLADKVWSEEERSLVLQLRKMISKFEESRDLRMLGGWKPGSDPELDKAVETVPVIYEAICQAPNAPLSENAFDDLIAFLKGNNQPEQSNEKAPAG